MCELQGPLQKEANTRSFIFKKSFYIVQGLYFLKIAKFSGNYFLFHCLIFRPSGLVFLIFRPFRVTISYLVSIGNSPLEKAGLFHSYIFVFTN